jgi:excisionase family DNA binding protein
VPTRLLTIAEVATALRVSRRTVETLLHERTLATTRIGWRVLVRESDLEEWIAAQVQHSADLGASVKEEGPCEDDRPPRS